MHEARGGSGERLGQTARRCARRRLWWAHADETGLQGGLSVPAASVPRADPNLVSCIAHHHNPTSHLIPR